MSLGYDDYTSRKNRKKIIRTVLEFIILAVLLYIVVTAIVVFKDYQPYNDTNTDYAGDKGFVGISYFGVDRIGNESLIGLEQLEHHLEVLKKNGYVTITGKDVESYYKTGRQLPRRSMYLMFEDGRRDTAIFAEKLLEKFNYHATMFSYVDKFEKKDTKFLMPGELKSMLPHGFWEMGTNGYRLYYINVFDRYNNYLGDMEPLMYSHLTSVLGRKYNHYLMDYIRDENDFPKESYLAMSNRFANDYERLEDVYTSDLGFVPDVYVLMHSNTGAFGNNPDVSKVNNYWIRKLFKMNFNREGYSFNDRKSSVYDLTRMQPQSYWPANHLLMRLKFDTHDDLTFENGDEKQYQDWTTTLGASEFRDESILLTSLPFKEGRMQLKGSEGFRDLKLTTVLKGNVFGQQKIYLRTNSQLSNFVVVSFANGYVLVGESKNGIYKELKRLKLKELDGIPDKSVDQDKHDVLVKDLEVLARYAPNEEQAAIHLERLKDKQLENPKSIQDGSPVYVPEQSYHERKFRNVEIQMKGNLLSLRIDGKDALMNVNTTVEAAGGVVLGAAWGGYGYSQRNLADDVYDGVFEGLKITDNGGSDAKVLYDVHYTGWAKYEYLAWKVWNKFLEWALRNF
jgi:hypothetical protein